MIEQKVMTQNRIHLYQFIFGKCYRFENESIVILISL